MYTLGIQLAQQYLSLNDTLIGSIGEADSGNGVYGLDDAITEALEKADGWLSHLIQFSACWEQMRIF